MRLSRAIPEAIKRPLRRFLAPSRLRRSWLTRTSHEGDDHLAIYWNAETQPNRLKLIQTLVDECEHLRSANIQPAILEYGSHVGLNLRMLNNVLQSDQVAAYFAIEPNAEAVNFLRQKLPFVHVLEGEDEAFCRQTDFPPNGNYLTFINSVFYAMEPRRVRAALTRICSFSNSVVLGESIENIDGMHYRMRDHPECFEHPYRLWLDELGFEIVSLETAPDPRPQLNGFVVARRRKA